MPLPSAPRAPYFKGTNIIEFIKRFEDLYTNYRINKPSRAKHVIRYYKTTIAQFVCNMPEFKLLGN